jgi:hypothetical protein
VVQDPAGPRVVDIDVALRAGAARDVFVHRSAAEATPGPASRPGPTTVASTARPGWQT